VSSTLTCIAEANGAKVVSNRQLAKHLLAYVQGTFFAGFQCMN